MSSSTSPTSAAERSKRFLLLSLPCRTLLTKEVHRFWTVAGQTVTAPLISASLYFFIFGVSLGSRISMIPGVSYLAFIIPGLIMMSILNNCYQNTASSIVNAKYHGNIKDVLIAPLNYREFVTAYVLAAMTRGLLVGSLVFLLSLLFHFHDSMNPALAFFVACLGSLTFALLGMIAGICSKGWEQLSVWSNFVLLPLTYLGGVFYSIDILPDFWRNLSCLNPLLYIVDVFRFAFLGRSDIHPLADIGVIILMASILFAICVRLLKSGYGLRT